MPIRNESLDSNCGYLEVFSTLQSGKVFGHRLVGAKPGPQLVVTGCGKAATKTFERLLKIPTLPWMRGALVLIRLDILENPTEDLDQFGHIGVIDRTLALSDRVPEEAPRYNYHLVLQACTQLGMIAGRGVPNPAGPTGVSIGLPWDRPGSIVSLLADGK